MGLRINDIAPDFTASTTQGEIGLFHHHRDIALVVAQLLTRSALTTSLPRTTDLPRLAALPTRCEQLFPSRPSSVLPTRCG